MLVLLRLETLVDKESKVDLDSVTIFVTLKFTKFLVRCEPCLPYHIRFDIIMLLSQNMKMKHLNRWSHERIVNSVLYTIANFFQVEKKEGCRNVECGTCVFPANLVFTPYAHHCHLYDELISLISIVCVSFGKKHATNLKDRQVALDDDDGVSDFHLALSQFINKPDECRNDDGRRILPRTDGAELIACLYLKGIIITLLDGGDDLQIDFTQSSAAHRSHFQDFLIENEEYALERLRGTAVGTFATEDFWWVNPIRSIGYRPIVQRNGSICCDGIDLFWRRLCSLLITTLFSAVSLEFSNDDDMHVSDVRLQLLNSICILFGRLKLALGSLSSVPISFVGDESNPFMVFTLENAKKIFQVCYRLCRNFSHQKLLSEQSFFTLKQVFDVIIDFSTLLEGIKERPECTNLETITTCVWNLYFLLFSDDQ